MLDRQRLLDMVARFGVAEPQVRRDHLISHLLAALSQHLPDKLLFLRWEPLPRSAMSNRPSSAWRTASWYGSSCSIPTATALADQPTAGAVDLRAGSG